MKTVFVILASLTYITTYAQDFQKEINEQVWKPFIKSFNERNSGAFLAVHSKDVVRSSRDSKEIIGWDEYNKQQEEGDRKGIASGRKHAIQLRFTERIASADKAIDVGIYKTTSTNAQGQSRTGYGRFHVVLRKETGTWKILVDTDSSEGSTIGERDFLAAKPLE